MLIPCPWCGPREEIEFHAGGEAGRIRPHDPSALDDADWADFLFMRENRRGQQKERWLHFAGCGRWFVHDRDNVSHIFVGAPDRSGGGA